jgi:DNA-binding transcriptional ArsR family regulator
MQVFAALAEPNRQRIVELLAAHGQLTAGDINREFAVSAAATSQHLKVLREAGLVRVEARAQQRLYSLEPAGFAEIEHWIAALRQHWTERFEALDELLRAETKKRKPSKRGHRP